MSPIELSWTAKNDMFQIEVFSITDIDADLKFYAKKEGKKNSTTFPIPFEALKASQGIVLSGKDMQLVSGWH